MNRLRVFAGSLAALVLAGVVTSANAASTPTLFRATSAQATVLAQGAQKSWPVKISEDSAFDAVFQGGMWLPNPSGGRIYATYVRHVLHPNGTWTWIGKVSTVHGEQSVILTFGKGGVFGLLPQASGYPLRIVTRHGQTRIVATSGNAMRRSPERLRLQARSDAIAPPRISSGHGGRQTTVAKIAAAGMPVRAAAGTVTSATTANATASGMVTIDVMVVYTPGFVAELGSVQAAQVRIQNLVDLTNQAYIDSGVNQQIRLVHTAEVNYTDDNSNNTALDDITGIDGNGNPVPIPASLQGVAPMRIEYGADLVSLIRSFNNTAQGNCGVGWLNGAGQTPINPATSRAFGYSVVSDGSNDGYYCLDTTFAHELGHNMGDDHDRAHSQAGGGAYPYSYGYLGNGTDGFSTIMAYGSATDTPVSVFSNPSISTCQNTPCGVPDSSSSSADNAHSMNNTAALIAEFEPTVVAPPPPSSTPYVHNDVSGDGTSSLLWYNASQNMMTFWLMDGPTMTSWQGISVPTGYTPIGTGDFYGNGYADILWTDADGNVYMWTNDGNGSFTSSLVTTAIPGWSIVGTVDINGDGKTDLIWYDSSTGQMTYWLMNGPVMTSWSLFNTNTGLQLVAAGHFNGSAYGNLLWKTPSGAMYMWLFNGSGTFSYYGVAPYPVGWVPAGTGDVNGDGKTDLFWYNPSTGQMTYWLMDGPTITSWKLFMTNTGLTPLATGVFDGEHAGITWQTRDGAMYMWQFNVANGTSFNYYSLGDYPTGWTPIP